MVKGETKRPGRIGHWIEVSEFSMGMATPYDPKTGAPKGRRPHSPIVVTKPTDAASPSLFQACATNEVFTTVHLEMVDDEGSGGVGRVIKKVRLTNAVIARIDPRHGAAANDYGFTFENIEVTL